MVKSHSNIIFDIYVLCTADQSSAAGEQRSAAAAQTEAADAAVAAAGSRGRSRPEAGAGAAGHILRNAGKAGG